VGIFVNFLRVPYKVLYPTILMFCVVGVYAVNSSLVDVGIMSIMGLLGYVLRKMDFETAPMVLGVVLAPIIEVSFRQSLAMSNGEYSIFVLRPISAVFLVGALAMILLALKPLIMKKKDWRAFDQAGRAIEGIKISMKNKPKRRRIMKKSKVNLLLVITACVGMIGLFSGTARADEPYPTRPIQVLVPFPPGGVADLVARPFSAALEKHLKQPVVVVNKTGAGGAVGMQAAAVAKPDGYSLMVALSSISVMPEVDALFGRPSTYKLKDFAPLALLTSDPTIFVIRKEAPWKTVADFVADAKKRPNEIKYASSGVYGTMHVAMEMFARRGH
jgi:hypothetical protein